jgi:hypothetical protein
MTATRSYAFAPKGAPGETSLVLVVAEASRDIGKADALAKKLGFKSMRAADDALVQKTLGVDKKDGALDRSSHLLLALSTYQPRRCSSNQKQRPRSLSSSPPRSPLPTRSPSPTTTPSPPLL